jgi:hypothetical protein
MGKVRKSDKDHPVALSIHDDKVWVSLKDGRIIGTPLRWYPWLAAASPEQQANFEFSAFSIFWPDLDDGLDIEAMLTGNWTTPMEDGVQTE